MDERRVLQTAKASVAAQFATNALIVSVFFVDWEAVPTPLKDVLLLESISQAVEFAWYATVLYRGWAIEASKRYYDWVVSTPLMLLSLALFFSYRRGGSVDEDRLALAAVLLFDELMLFFGYLLERGRLSAFLAVLFGMLSLVGVFVSLSAFVEPDDGLSQGLLVATMLVWSLYGFAALLPTVPKNVAYNLLDLVAKNAFGLFLTILVLVEYGE